MLNKSPDHNANQIKREITIVPVSSLIKNATMNIILIFVMPLLFLLVPNKTYGQGVMHPYLNNYFIEDDGTLLLLFNRTMDTTLHTKVTPEKYQVRTHWKTTRLLELNGTFPSSEEHGEIRLRLTKLRDINGLYPERPVVLKINVDTKRPRLSSTDVILNNGGNFFNQNHVQAIVKGMGDESGFGIYSFKLDTLEATVTKDSTFTFFDLAEGNHIVQVQASDKSGNKSETVSITFTIDLINPEITGMSVHSGLKPKEIIIRISFSEAMKQSILPVLKIENNGESMGNWVDDSTCEAVFPLPQNATARQSLILSNFSDLSGSQGDTWYTSFSVPLPILLDYTAYLEKQVKWDKASTLYSLLKQQYPLDITIREKLITLYQKKNNAAASFQEILELSALSPGDTSLRKELGKIALSLGRKAESHRQLLHLLHLRKTSEKPTDSLFNKENFDGFRIISDNYVYSPREMNKYAASFMDEGIERAKSENYEGALESFKNAEKFKAGKLLDYNRAVVFHTLNENETAIDLLQELGNEQLEIPVLSGIAAIHARQGKQKNAIVLYTATDSLQQNPIHHSNYGVLLMKTGEQKKALKQIKKAALKSDDPRIQLNYAHALFLTGKYKKAIGIYDILIKHQVKAYPDMYAGRAQCYLSLGKNNKAVQDFQRALIIAPCFVDAALHIASLQLAHGDLEKSKNNLEYVLSIDSGSQRASQLLAGVYQALGDKKKAREKALQALKDKKSRNKKKPDAKTAAVLLFNNNTRDSSSKWIALAAAEAVSSDMQEYSPYRMLDRIWIMNVIDELEYRNAMDASGEFEYSESKMMKEVFPKLNSLVPVQKLVLGSYQSAGRKIRFDARLIDMKTGKVEETAFATGSLDELGMLERKLALTLSGVTGTPSMIGLSSTVSTAAQRKIASAQQALINGDKDKAQQLSAEALAIDPNVLRIMNETVLVGEDEAAGKSLAVIPFTNISKNKQNDWISMGIQEALITDLKQAELYMVERSQIQKIMEEQDFSQTDLVNDSTAPEIGALVSAGVLITGAYQVIYDEIKINARMVLVESGEIRLATSVKGSMNDILNLEGELALKILRALNVEINNHARSKIANKHPMALKSLQNEMQRSLDLADIKTTEEKMMKKSTISEAEEKALKEQKWKELTDLEAVQAILDSNNINGVKAKQLVELDKENRVIKLDLSNKAIMDIPAEIGRLQKLKQLNLRKNILIVLPPQIGQLASLEYLDLSINQITTLPAQIGWLTKLKKLNLNRNNLEELPFEITELKNLESFNLNFNRLTDLPQGFQKLKKLKYLALSGNELKSLPKTLRRVKARVLFGSNRLCNVSGAQAKWLNRYSKSDKWKYSQRCSMGDGVGK
ncbi:MAG: leucine-rich repeat domain-containing protein [Fibrobacteria bacterium]|nr:leucine-rich repeat domain-containing protein [Fibrobacteria bacterium]